MASRWICIVGLYLLAVGIAFGEGTFQRTKDGKTIVWNADPKPGDTATWVGDRDAEGYATKIGTLTWYTARGTVFARFRGNMVRGKFDGTVNGYSKGRIGHAVFAAGNRTTRWVAGASAAAETAQRQLPPAKPETPTEPNTPGADNRTATAASARPPPAPVSRERNESAAEKLLKKAAPEADRERPRPAVATIEPSPLPESSPPNVGKIEPSPLPESSPPNVATIEPPSLPENSPPNVDRTPDVATPSSPNTQTFSEPAQTAVASQPSAPPVASVQQRSPRTESESTEPVAPAEGPRVEIPEDFSAPPSSPSAEEQEIAKEPASPSPEEQTANAPVAEPSQSSVSGSSIQSAEGQTRRGEYPGSGIPTPDAPALPSTTLPNAKVEAAATPRTTRNLTTDQVIMLANAELRKHGFDRAQYLREEPQFDEDHRAWSVEYQPMTFDGTQTAGQHFSIVVDDRTKGTLFLLRK